MMLDHLGHAEAAAHLMSAIERVLATGPRTADLGGDAKTADVGQAIVDAIGESATVMSDR